MMKKKIMLIGHFPPPYDGTAIAMDAIRNSEIINEYFYLTYINTSRLKFSTDTDIGRITYRKAIQDFKCLFKFFNRLIIERPHIIYMPIAQTKWGYIRDSINIIIAKLFRKKCIIHLHGGYFRLLYEDSPKFFQYWIKFTLSQVDKAIVLTNSLLSLFKGLIDDRNIKVIPNFVEDYIFPSASEIEAKINRIKNHFEKEIKLLFMSNLLKPKGYLDAIKSAIILKQRGVPIRFFLAGNYPNEKEKLEAMHLIVRHNMDNIEFLGFVTGGIKKQILLNSDIFILPTSYYYEGLPISILEAMASGLAVITTPHGGIPGIIEEGINGFFVQPKNPEAIAEKIYMLYSNPSLCVDIAKNNIEKAAKNFRKEHYENALLKIFHKI